MILPANFDVFTTADTIPTDNGTSGFSLKFKLDRTYPIDTLLLMVRGTTNADASWSTTANYFPDGILGLIKRVTLTVNDGQQRTVVDASGPALLEFWDNVGGSFDGPTLAAINTTRDNIGNALATATTYQMCFPIPLAHPQLQDPLRTFTLLPAHMHQQDPVLEVQFASATEYSNNAAMKFNTIGCEVLAVRRQISAQMHDSIISAGGFIASDLVESEWSYGTAGLQEARIEIPSPGYYSGLLIRSYKGNVVGGNRQNLSRSSAPAAATLYSELYNDGEMWRIENAGFILRRFRWEHLRAVNDFSKPAMVFGAGNNTTYRMPRLWGNYYLDFINDGVSGDAAELGSLLDTNLAAARGVKWQLIGNLTGGTGYKVKLLGHRFYGDVNRFRVVKQQTASA
jgi:hypothetical protein